MSTMGYSRNKQTGVVEDMNFQGLKEKACRNSRGSVRNRCGTPHGDGKWRLFQKTLSTAVMT